MSKYSYTESMTVHLSDFGDELIKEYMASRGYELAGDEEPDDLEAELLIDQLQNHPEFMYQEKENIRVFFLQDKFKSVPNKDLVEFLNRYP